MIKTGGTAMADYAELFGKLLDVGTALRVATTTRLEFSQRDLLEATQACEEWAELLADPRILEMQRRLKERAN